MTYAKKIDKAEAAVDWRCDADAVARRIRAFNPAPGAVARWRGEAIKLWMAQPVPGVVSAQAPGTVVEVTAEGIVVVCGQGAVRLTELQRPGGKRLPAAQFLQGQALQVGECFEMPAAG